MTETIAKLIQTAATALKEHRLTVATAESCTGGGLSYWLTDLAGSSAWFERGFVTYSNEAKIELLGVKPQTLDKFGAVSEEVVREMAEGALLHSHASISIAITGIAGPDGGSPQKPVGTVWMGWARRGMATQTDMQVFSGDRQTVRIKTISHCIDKLLALIR